MKVNKVLAVATLLNMIMMIYVLAQARPAAAQGDASVLRGRALEIVDSQGRVRASLSIEPAVKNGTTTTYPETVLFRMGDPNLMPVVKITASENASGLMLWQNSGPVLFGSRSSGR